MKNLGYISQRIHPDEGFGSYMNTLSSIYCISTFCGLKPAFIKGQTSNALQKFNFGVAEKIDFDEAFPNLPEYFSIIPFDSKPIEYWQNIKTVYVGISPPWQAAKNIEPYISYKEPEDIFVNSFFIYQNIHLHRSKLKHIFSFSDKILESAKKFIPSTSKKLVGVSTRYLNPQKKDSVESNMLSLGLDYYEKAFSFFDSSQYSFIVSGDDQDEPKKFFSPLADKYEIHYLPKIHSSIGICLISMCDGIINSNSSFSFWASILSDSAQKIICPSKYLIDGSPGSEHLNNKWYDPNWTAI